MPKASFKSSSAFLQITPAWYLNASSCSCLLIVSRTTRTEKVGLLVLLLCRIAKKENRKAICYKPENQNRNRKSALLGLDTLETQRCRYRNKLRHTKQQTTRSAQRHHRFVGSHRQDRDNLIFVAAYAPSLWPCGTPALRFSDEACLQRWRAPWQRVPFSGCAFLRQN